MSTDKKIAEVTEESVTGVPDELVAEINSAVDDMVSSELSDEEKAVDYSAEASTGKSDEEKAAAEVAESDRAGDLEVAATEEAAEKLADEEGKLADEAAKEVADSAVSDEILERAVNVGIPVVDAKALSPGSLERIIEGREAAEEEARQAEEERIVSEKGVAEVDPFAEMPKLDPEVHDPSVIEMFEKQNAILRQQYETIQGFQTKQDETALAVQNAEAARLDIAAQEIEQFFDGQVDKLGDDFTEALGTGKYSSLDKGSTQFAKREAIAQQMAVLHSGYEVQGCNPPSRVALFDMAARSVLQDEYQALRDKKLSSGLEEQSGQHLQRAGGVQAKSSMSPEEEIAAEIDAKFYKTQ